MGQTNTSSCSGMWNIACSPLDGQFEWSNNYDVGRKDSPGKHRDCPLRPVSGTKHQAVRKAIEGPRTHSCPLVGLLELRQKKSGAEAPLFNLVSKGGLEPPRPCGRRPLKPVRLPISPLRRGFQDTQIALRIGRANSARMQAQ